MNNHLHHIIPRCKGGSDDPSNLVSLSPYKHAYLHAVDFIKRFFFYHSTNRLPASPKGLFSWYDYSIDTRRRLFSSSYETRDDDRYCGWGCGPGVWCSGLSGVVDWHRTRVVWGDLGVLEVLSHRVPDRVSVRRRGESHLVNWSTGPGNGAFFVV